MLRTVTSLGYTRTQGEGIPQAESFCACLQGLGLVVPLALLMILYACHLYFIHMLVSGWAPMGAKRPYTPDGEYGAVFELTGPSSWVGLCGVVGLATLELSRCRFHLAIVVKMSSDVRDV